MEAKYIIEYSDFPGQKVLSKINGERDHRYVYTNKTRSARISKRAKNVL